MIILNEKNFKSKNFKDKLNEYENILNYGFLSCPICESCNIIKYGKYERNIYYSENGKVYSMIIKVQRVKCKSCNHTHALIIDEIIPYKQYNLSIVINTLLNEKINIDLDIIKKWKRQFIKNHLSYIKTTFKEKNMKELLIKIKENLKYRKEYLSVNNKYFMQIKMIPIKYAGI